MVEIAPILCPIQCTLDLCVAYDDGPSHVSRRLSALQNDAADIPAKLAEVLGLTEHQYSAYQKMLTDLSMKLGLSDATC